jgi:hypothetical protein
MSDNRWFGPTETVLRVLSELGADLDEHGKGFRLSKGRVIFGLGDQEMIVAPDVSFYLNGEAWPLVDELQKESEGLMVRVL